MGLPIGLTSFSIGFSQIQGKGLEKYKKLT
jgi:hypothetical protein